MSAEPTPRPRVVVATTNFPLRVRGDATGNFVVDPVIALANDVDQVVVAPHAHATARSERFNGHVEVRRFGYFWPRRLQRLAYGDGIPTNVGQSWLARAQLPSFVASFEQTITRAAKNADLIHAHWLEVAALAKPAARKWGLPLMVTLHGTDVTQFPDRIVRGLLKLCDVVVSSHDDLLATASTLAPGVRQVRIRHLVEPQPVEPADRAAIRNAIGEGPVVLHVGRLSPERDPMTLVRAAPAVIARHPDVRFLIVGDGALRGEVQDAIRRLGLASRVLLLGHRPNVWTYLAEASVFTALSPRNNAWVTTMVEAMRAEVPVVGTTSGATPQALRDGIDALLVPSADVAAVSDAIIRLLDDERLRHRIASGATTTLYRAGFDPGEVKARTLGLYRELAERSRAGRGRELASV